MPVAQAIPLSIIGNILPIPFILLFIRQIFKWMKKIKIFRGLVERLEAKAMGKYIDNELSDVACKISVDVKSQQEYFAQA